MRLKKKLMSDAEAKAATKRARKAEVRLRLAFRPIVPTNHPGPEFARAEIRRMDRRLRKKAKRDRSATAAKARISVARDGRAVGIERDRREAEKSKLSPLPAEWPRMSKAKRREWAVQREVDRQRHEMESLVHRGVPRDDARRRFGSL